MIINLAVYTTIPPWEILIKAKLTTRQQVHQLIRCIRLPFSNKSLRYLENNSTSHKHTHCIRRKTHMHNFPNTGYGHCVGRVRAKGGTYKRCLCAR